MQKGIVTLLWSFLLGSAQPYQLTSDFKVATVRKTVALGLVESKLFRKEALRVLGDDRIRVGTFTLYRSEYDMTQAKPQGGTDCSFDSWLDTLDRRGLKITPLRCPIVAHAIKVGHTIAVRSNDAQCNGVINVIKGGHDATRITLNGAKFDLVDLIIVEDEQPGVTLYVRTDAIPDRDVGEAVFKYFQRMTGQSRLSVVIRNDNSFFTECAFPIISGLINRRRPVPDAAVFSKTKQIYCGAQPGWPMQCY